MQKNPDFDYLIANYKYYKFVKEDIEIDVEKEEKQIPEETKFDLDIKNYNLMINPVKKFACKIEKIIILPNLKIRIFYADDKKTNVSRNNLVSNHVILSNLDINCYTNIFLSDDLEIELKKYNHKMKTFFKRFDRFSSFKFQNLQNNLMLKNFFLLDLNAKFHKNSTKIDFNYVKPTTFETFQQFFKLKTIAYYI